MSVKNVQSPINARSKLAALNMPAGTPQCCQSTTSRVNLLGNVNLDVADRSSVLYNIIVGLT